MVRRLQRMDVEVACSGPRRLRCPITAVRPARRPATLPAGTYWVPMAQAQKHWVQAMLNEDTYTPSRTSTT